MIEEFLRILPDSGPVFIEEMKTQGAHRRQMESEAAAASERRFDRGQVGAFVVAVVGLACGMAAIVWSGGATGAYVFATVVSALGIGGPPTARIFIERGRMRREGLNRPTDTNASHA